MQQSLEQVSKVRARIGGCRHLGSEGIERIDRLPLLARAQV